MMNEIFQLLNQIQEIATWLAIFILALMVHGNRVTIKNIFKSWHRQAHK